MLEWMLLGTMLSLGQAGPEKPKPETKQTAPDATVKPVQEWPPASVILTEENGNGNGNGNGEETDEDEEDEGPDRLFPDEILGFKVTGWIYGTANYNANNGGSRYNGPLTLSDQEGGYLNQLYLSIDRAMQEEFSVGGNVTFLYGNDYNPSQSFGWELNSDRLINPAAQKWNTGQDYGLAIPQLYGEVGTKKASLLVGHFWTPIGHCVVPAIGNFFNTQPYSYMHGQPFDHWGAMAKFAPNDNWSGYAAIVNGWGALDRQENSAAFMGGVKYTADEEKWSSNLQVYTGDEPENISTGYSNRTLINHVLRVNVTEKIEFVSELTLGVQQNGGGPTSTYYGVSPYLFYKITDNLKAGSRLDWFYDPTGIVAGIRTGNPNVGPYRGDFYTVSTGLNWAPGGSKNLMIRPEVRYDWFDGNGTQPFNGGNSDHMWLFVLGAYYQF